MNKIFLYNTLNKKKEEFKSITDKEVGLYTCGPTVYNYAHIGNLRSFLFEDILERVLEYNGYKVKRVMNITDVGHLTGDRDMGEDKLEKSAQKEGKTAWEVAEFYTSAFLTDLKALNIKIPKLMPKVTEYIKEQIALIKILEDKGYVYEIGDGIYYDTSKFADYNKLNHKNLDDLLEGARVEKNDEKKNPTDFALWKFSYLGGRDFDASRDDENTRRHMEWPSPWGLGFPGWHIECSAMSASLLWDNMDIHCGGIDHIDIHHTNEIAQSEAAYEKPFFNYWMHNAFLNIVGGKKMAKSDGNFLTLENALINKGYHPLAYRFMALSVHYRKPMEWSEEAIEGAQSGLNRLNARLRELNQGVGDYEPNEGDVDRKYKQEFLRAINDDLNIPQALAVMQKILKSDLSQKVILSTILDFDKIFGLNLNERRKVVINKELKDLVKKRNKAREEKNWEESDRLRDEIESMGYVVEDSGAGGRIFKK